MTTDTTELEGRHTQLARKNGLRSRLTKALGAYEIYLAKGELPEPIWPKESKTINDAALVF
jgi:hypothetical protein